MTTRKKLFLLKIVTAYGNRGDLLINRSLIQNLRNFGSVKVLTRDLPAKFLSDLQLSETESSESFIAEFLRNAGRSDVYVVGIPGHHFGNNSKLPAAALGLLLTIISRTFLRSRFIKIGTSLGPLSRQLIKLERLKAQFYVLYGVRDHQSLELCGRSRMQYFPDLAFISSDIPKPPSPPPGPSGGYILITFRKHPHELLADDQYLDSVIGKLKFFFESTPGLTAVVAFQVGSDKRSCQTIYRSLEGVLRQNVTFIDRVLDLDESLELIRCAEYVFSNRLHVLLPALIMGVPHVGLTDTSRHIKLKSLYDSIGAGDLIQNVYSKSAFTLPLRDTRERLRNIARKQEVLALNMLAEILGDK